MPTVYCYPVKLTIAVLICVKSICSQTHFSHIINRLLTSRLFGLYCEISDLCFLHGPRSFVARSILKNLGLIFHSTDRTSERSIIGYYRLIISVHGLQRVKVALAHASGNCTILFFNLNLLIKYRLCNHKG